MSPKKTLLVGGGHSHALALLQLRHCPEITVTLAAKSRYTPYSGMLPGFVAGHYRRRQCFIDLRALAQKTGAVLIEKPAAMLSADRRVLTLSDGERLSFDILSLNIGGAQKFAFSSPPAKSVKPIEEFMEWIRRLDECDEKSRIVVVGAGAGGVELSLALDFRLRRRHGGRRPQTMTLIGRRLLHRYPAAARRYFRKIFKQRGIELMENKTAVDARAGKLILSDGGEIAADKLLFATPVAAAEWPQDSGLQTDAQGFVQIGADLQSVSHAGIFACGDCAAFQPKSGVVAVRQAPVLAHNLLAAARGAAMRKFCPPPRLLSIISGGEKTAMAVYGAATLQGRWVWRWKNWLDTKFMNKFV